ncbi:putative viral a-type inclusion protein repeat protein [Rosellinia necatrix]|uniref:Putative viral a-type inclusion protein repeat protein n=1 Tax=Rosellinia necatrix TaxID=77044 RepID=A0A1W2TF49_ROSNE|nr:putative viral a-type inclusion protein repeat protein [Rosellinia necatrix]
MFSRLKDALDRTLAEEAARQRAAAEQRANTNEPAGTPAHAQQPAPIDSINPDPAVFEAALKRTLEADSEAPAPAASGEDTKESTHSTGPAEKASTPTQNDDADKVTGAESSGKPNDPAAPSPSTKPQRSPETEALDAKWRSNYGDLLRSYRIAHSRIEPFERALREHTPLSSIKQPAAFVEYLTQLNQKNDMVMQEMKRVSAERDVLKKQNDEVDKRLVSLQEETDKKFGVLMDDLARAKTAKEDVLAELSKTKDAATATKGFDEAEGTLDVELNSLAEEHRLLLEREETIKRQRDLLAAALLRTGSRDEDPEIVVEETMLTLEQLSEKNLITLEQFSGDNIRLLNRLSRLNSRIKTHTITDTENSKTAQELPETLRLASKATETTENLLDAPLVTPSLTIPTTVDSAESDGGNKEVVPPRPAETTSGEGPELLQASFPKNADIEALTAVIYKLRDEIIERDARIDNLSQRRKTEEDLREEIEIMREDLLSFGQEHVEAKERIKQLEEEKANDSKDPEREEMRNELLALREENIETAKTNKSLEREKTTLQSQISELEKKLVSFDELKVRTRTLESELGASQKVAQDRFKDITNLKEVLAKAQPELKSLRQDSAALKTTREKLTTKENELRASEKREKDLKNELTRIQRISSDREAGIKLLNDRLTAEKTSYTKLEDEKRTMGRDYRRLQAEKNEIVLKAEKSNLERDQAQTRVAGLVPKVKDLMDEVAKLLQEKNLAKEEIDLRTQQFDNAQGLLTSMRDQSVELSMQLKEAQTKAESLEEELAEAQKHLSERTREAEVMRRMLVEENEKANQKVRDMKSQMDAAVEERDQLEQQSSTTARKLAREAEELKIKLRELERDTKALTNEKDDLVAREREWHRRREELEQIEEKATAETEDMRSTVSSLRSALDASEQQVRDVEQQKLDLRKLLDEARARYERANKELKGIQSRLNVGTGPSNGRSSMDPTKSGADITSSKGPINADYIKTIFLQFLELDEKLRPQMIIVLARLLGFTNEEKERGLKALQRLHANKS